MTLQQKRWTCMQDPHYILNYLFLWGDVKLIINIYIFIN